MATGMATGMAMVMEKKLFPQLTLPSRWVVSQR